MDEDQQKTPYTDKTKELKNNQHQKATNIIWHEGAVSQIDREKLLKQKGMILWFTGLSGSGKSTIAVKLERELYQRGFSTYRLDGDNIRHGLNSDLGFSTTDREQNIRRIGEVAKLMQDAGLMVLCSFISPKKELRQFARQLVPSGKFLEIYVKVSIDTCKKRDPKGLYAKAIQGIIPNFTGISAPYDEPDNPEIVLDTDELSLQQSVEKILEELKL